MTCCPCISREKHLKNYRRAIKDRKGILHNKFFIFGQNENSESFLNFYDHATKKLINLSTNELLYNYCGSTMIDTNRIFICGGVNFAMNNVVANAKIYNIFEEKFSSVPNMHEIRFNFPILFYKDRIYVTGGRGYGSNEAAIMKKCEYFDMKLNKWVRMADMNVKRCAHQIFVYKKKIYVLGGLSVDTRVRFLEEYNPFTNTWRITTKALVFDLYNFEIFSHELDEILIIGGLHSKGYSNFIHSFNMKDSRILSKGFLSNHRSNFKLFYNRSKQKLILMGGAVPVGVQPHHNYMESFDLINQKSSSCVIDPLLVMDHIIKFNHSKASVIVKTSSKNHISISSNLIK
jgi:hypothetical protein